MSLRLLFTPIKFASKSYVVPENKLNKDSRLTFFEELYL